MLTKVPGVTTATQQLKTTGHNSIPKGTGVQEQRETKFQVLISNRMDNISAVRYINRLGGTRSKPLAELAKGFWEFCLLNRISVQAEYLPGHLSVVADWYS
ncbi:hypothetical protein NDU88_007793 [Pleurodeles waltl]|uniref:Uncharacterized protein n=1 Tax=Pleurodeles waltl TaxID=8319 RepID=A0AAV7STI8_PLEWA|nr:hypothetical protein NDU88_007793 [Pleurodeles waltl]